MKYLVKVPPTKDMGSYSAICRGNYMQSYQQDALLDYNHARAHDGLDPLCRMPKGTIYTPEK